MRAPPSTGQLSRDILLIKSLELGVVIGVAMTCCCVFYTFSYLRTFPTYGHPLVPRCPDKRGLSVYHTLGYFYEQLHKVRFI